MVAMSKTIFQNMSKKRKIDAQGRQFHEWKENNIVRRMSVVKEFNLRRHFDSKHGAKYAKFSLQERKKKTKNRFWFWNQNNGYSKNHKPWV